MPHLSFIADEARRLDRDRFLCALFAPMPAREALFALYAFNAEVARVPEIVREPLAGRIRLQWWRDAIAAIYGGDAAPAHPIARAVAEAVHRYRLDRALFEGLLDAREFDLEDEPPPDMEALVAYAEATSGNLALLSLACLGVGDEAAHAAGRHVGVAWSLTGLIRALPFHVSQSRVYLPATLSRETGADLRALSAGRADAGVRRSVAALAETARHHLASARQRRREVPERALPALLPATLADAYLAAIGDADHDPFDRRVQATGAGQLVRLGVSAWRRRF